MESGRGEVEVEVDDADHHPGSGEPGDARSRLLDLFGVGLGQQRVEGRNEQAAGLDEVDRGVPGQLLQPGKGHLAGVDALDDPDPADGRHTAERLVELIRTSTRVVSCDGSGCSPGAGTLSIEITDWSTSSAATGSCACRV
jgi:hypothetical protein